VELYCLIISLLTCECVEVMTKVADFLVDKQDFCESQLNHRKLQCLTEDYLACLSFCQYLENLSDL
jgi:hypothetical protein